MGLFLLGGPFLTGLGDLRKAAVDAAVPRRPSRFRQQISFANVGRHAAPGDQRLERRIVRRPTEAVEAPVLQARNARCELEAKEAQSANTWSESPPPSVWWRRIETSL